MESIIEKITLYDILGYLFPGSFFLIMILLGGIREELIDKMMQWETSYGKGILYVAFILTGYLTGILFSELNELIQMGLKKLIVLVKKTEFGKQKLKNNRQIESMIQFFDKQLVKALIQSGICDEENTIKQKLQNDEGISYFKYIYGVVQRSQDNNRLHSYASAIVMYKNIAVAVSFGALILYCGSHVNGAVLVVSFIISLLLMLRSRRFDTKAKYYALIWFLEKYGCV